MHPYKKMSPSGTLFISVPQLPGVSLKPAAHQSYQLGLWRLALVHPSELNVNWNANCILYLTRNGFGKLWAEILITERRVIYQTEPKSATYNNWCVIFKTIAPNGNVLKVQKQSKLTAKKGKFAAILLYILNVSLKLQCWKLHNE